MREFRQRSTYPILADYVSSDDIGKDKGQTLLSLPLGFLLPFRLLGGHFFLFAFHAHLFKLALFGFDRRSNFLLHLGCRFFQLR